MVLKVSRALTASSIDTTPAPVVAPIRPLTIRGTLSPCDPNWRPLKSVCRIWNRSVPSIEPMTWQEYETGLEDRLADLHGRVHRGAIRAQPSRRVYIPKG